MLQPGPRDAFSFAAMEEDDFLVGNDGSTGFGGGITGDFVQFARWTGDLENNPQNTVHRLVGGDEGFMANALMAGLDPIFWLHHCNIDRMWEAWMNAPGKTMVRDPRWLDGPADRTFIMPALGGGDPGLTFTGRDTLQGGKLHPTYDNLTSGTGVTPGVVVVARVGMGPADQQNVEPIGANSAAVTVGAEPARTEVDLQPQAARAGIAAMGATAQGETVSRLYLALESVRGSAPSPLIEVYVNVPDGADPQSHPELFAGSLTLFGLNVASQPDGDHGGNGLGYTLDITDLARRLTEAGEFDPNRLRVTLVPGEQVSDAKPVTVEKISVLKRSGVVS
jgi:tyrosinase